MTLILAYNFNEASGTTILDRSGNGRDGTLSGSAIRSANAVGCTSAALVNGSGVSIPRAGLEPASAISITLQALFSTNSDYAYQPLVSKSRPSGADDSYGIYASLGSKNKPQATLTTTQKTLNLVAPSVLANGWRKLGLTWDGATMRFYVDGAVVASGALTGTLVYNTSSLPYLLNWFNYPDSAAKNTYIDDLRIYDHKLTDAEVVADGNTPVPDSVSTTVPSKLYDSSGAEREVFLWNGTNLVPSSINI